MKSALVQEIGKNAVTIGATVLMPQGLQFRRPIDVVNAPTNSVDDKWGILAACASSLYALDSRPALRHVPETPDPVSIDDLQSALKELDRPTSALSNRLSYRRQVIVDDHVVALRGKLR